MWTSSYKDDRSKLTNFNISVAVTDQFLETLKADPGAVHQVRNPRTGDQRVLEREDGTPWTVGEMWESIVEHAHASGEPGIIFIDRINASNPIKNVGEIGRRTPAASSPCTPGIRATSARSTSAAS